MKANRTLTEKININIMENELDATDWNLNGLAWELYWWTTFFNIRFFKDTPVPIPALTFEKSRVTTLGHYRIGRNDFAVREQINLNKLHLNRPLWDILATLLHEMVHSWEYCYLPEKERTKNWYHTKTFRQKMEEFGIICDEKGCHVGLVKKGLFVWTLRQHSVSLSEIPNYNISGMSEVFPIEPKKKPKGKSKLKKWSCGCTNIRVAVPNFKAMCLRCENEFELVE
jgi:hypothetical protein